MKFGSASPNLGISEDTCFLKKAVIIFCAASLFYWIFVLFCFNDFSKLNREQRAGLDYGVNTK